MPIDPVILEYAKTYGLPILGFGAVMNLFSYIIALSEIRKKHLAHPISSFLEMDCYIKGCADREPGLLNELGYKVIDRFLLPGEYAAYLNRKYIL